MTEKHILQNYRDQIDTLDKELLYLFYRRFELVKQIWTIKKEEGIAILQADRWKKLLEENIEVWEEMWLSREFITSIWNKIHEKSLEIEG